MLFVNIEFFSSFFLWQMYDEFCPLLLNQFKSRDSTQFETFDAALDEFYSKIESQRAEQQHKTKENSAMQKLEKIKVDQVNHLCLYFSRTQKWWKLSYVFLIIHNNFKMHQVVFCPIVSICTWVCCLKFSGIEWGRTNTNLQIAACPSQLTKFPF